MVEEKFKFNEGDVVYEITRPHHLLLIARRHGNVYYCKEMNGRNDKLSAYMQRDLKGFHAAIDSNVA